MNVGIAIKVRITLLLIGSILFLQNCAPSRTTKIAAVVTSDQKIGYEETITSQKKHFVSLSPYSKLNVQKDKTMFMLVVQNCGEDPIDISYNNISVLFEENGMNWALNKINVQSFDDFMNDLKKEYSNTERKFIRSALEDIILKLESSTSVLDSFDSLSSSGFNNSSSSNSSSSSTSSSFSSDNLADTIEVMVDDLMDDIEMMRSNNLLLRQALPEFVMKPQTIMPGNSYSGIVICDTSDMNSEIEGNFQIVVLVEREKHRFTFNRSLI